jgi:hypothetical protein
MPIIFLNPARGFSWRFSWFTDYNLASTVFFHYLFRCRRDLFGTKDFAFRQKQILGKKRVLFVCWQADSVCMTLTHSMSTSTSIKPWNPFLPPQGLSGSFVRLPLQLYDARALGQVRPDNLAPQPTSVLCNC